MRSLACSSPPWHRPPRPRLDELFPNAPLPRYDGLACARLACGYRDGGDGELERRAASVARGHPDTAAEAALDDKTAQVETQPKAALRAVAPRWARLLEQALEASGRQTRSMVGHRHLEPAP